MTDRDNGSGSGGGPERVCPDCESELEPAFEDDPDNDWFCVVCGGLYVTSEVVE